MSSCLGDVEGVRSTSPTKGIIAISSTLRGSSTFAKAGRSTFLLAVKPLYVLGGGVSRAEAGLFLVVAFSANVFDVGAFFWKSRKNKLGKQTSKERDLFMEK